VSFLRYFGGLVPPDPFPEEEGAQNGEESL
jgi:hypothetical protein